MTPFAYAKARHVDEAVFRAPDVVLLAGGTSLVDLMALGVEAPEAVLDISGLSELLAITRTAEGGLRIGALASNTAVAEHPGVISDYPGLAMAITAGASVQIRNAATAAGNLLQRTRCPYFRDPAFPCNKRRPGSGCPAIGGVDRALALLGASDQCIATMPSDMAQALVALDAVIEVRGQAGARRIAANDFHRLPGDDPARDNTLLTGELITAIVLPPPSVLSRSSVYVKVRDRTSYAYALVSAAAALVIVDGGVADVRLVLGGVAAKPWRSRGAEILLRGHAADGDRFAAAADRAVEGARTSPLTARKPQLAAAVLVEALRHAERA